MTNLLTASQEELVNEHYAKVGKISHAFAYQYKHVDADDLASFLNEEMLKMVQQYDSTKGDAGKFFNACLKRKAITFINSGYAQYNKVSKPISQFATDGDDTGYTQFEKLSKELNTEFAMDDAIDGIEYKKAFEKLFSIADATQQAIMREFLLDADATPNAVGKKLGIHHMTVQRSLAKLCKGFNGTSPLH